MMGILKDFETYKAELKQKWIEYYEANLELFDTINMAEYRRKCPDSSMILALIMLTDSQAKEYIELLSMANSDKDKLVQLLELNFNINEEIEKRKQEKTKNELVEYQSPLDDFRQNTQQN